MSLRWFVIRPIKNDLHLLKHFHDTRGGPKWGKLAEPPMSQFRSDKQVFTSQVITYVEMRSVGRDVSVSLNEMNVGEEKNKLRDEIPSKLDAN